MKSWRAIAVILWLLIAVLCSGQDLAKAGIVADGKTDCTAALQKLLDSRRCVRLPAGDYLAGSLVVNWHLTGDPGAFLIKNPNSDPGQPLVRGNDREFSITNLTLKASKPSPNGVLYIGPHKGATRNVFGWRVRDVTVYGVRGSESVAVLLASSEPKPPIGTGQGSNYSGVLSGCLIVGTDYGLRLGPLCNGHIFESVRYHDIGKIAFDAEECSDFGIPGGFVHHSYGALCARFRNCKFFHVDGFIGEPGGEGRFIETDEQCEAFSVRTQDNCKHGPILKGRSWSYESHGIRQRADDKGKVTRQ